MSILGLDDETMYPGDSLPGAKEEDVEVMQTEDMWLEDARKEMARKFRNDQVDLEKWQNVPLDKKHRKLTRARMKQAYEKHEIECPIHTQIRMMLPLAPRLPKAPGSPAVRGYTRKYKRNSLMPIRHLGNAGSLVHDVKRDNRIWILGDKSQWRGNRAHISKPQARKLPLHWYLSIDEEGDEEGEPGTTTRNKKLRVRDSTEDEKLYLQQLSAGFSPEEVQQVDIPGSFT